MPTVPGEAVVATAAEEGGYIDGVASFYGGKGHHFQTNPHL